MTDSINIGFLLYPGIIQLDIMAVDRVLSFPPNAKIHLLWKNLTLITSNEGLIITPTTTFHNCPQLDVICVPGGGMGQVAAMKDREILDFLQRISTTTKYITSVCTGSLLLAAANLLQGYRATCHWAFREQLAMLGVEVIPHRVIIDRDLPLAASEAVRITGAGVTSGLDFALTLVSLIWDERMAKMAQLMMEYNPQPPFNAGDPDTTEKEVVGSLLKFGKPLIDAFLSQTKEISAKSKL